MQPDDGTPQPSLPRPVVTDVAVDPSDDADTPLRSVAMTWMRRGYRVGYRDAFLIQLRRQGRPGWRSASFVALALAAQGVAVVAWFAALRCRPWHIVTLVIGPENKILTHHQRAPRLPAP